MTEEEKLKRVCNLNEEHWNVEDIRRVANMLGIIATLTSFFCFVCAVRGSISFRAVAVISVSTLLAALISMRYAERRREAFLFEYFALQRELEWAPFHSPESVSLQPLSRSGAYPRIASAEKQK